MTTRSNPPQLRWLKLFVDFFDDEKIKLIDALPDRDAILVIWFKLLAVAGKSNAGGLLMLEKRIPITVEMLATILNRPLVAIELALKTFESFGMVTVEEKTIRVESWHQFQSLDADGKYREAAKRRMADYRERKSLKSSSLTKQATHSLRNVTPPEQEAEQEGEGERVKETDTTTKKSKTVVDARTSEIEKGYTLLRDVGIGIVAARKLSKKYDIRRIKEVVDRSMEEVVRNPGGFIISALEEGWVSTPARTGPERKTFGERIGENISRAKKEAIENLLAKTPGGEHETIDIS